MPVSTSGNLVLPGGGTLAPGEQPVESEQFMYSTIAFYVYTNLVLTNRRLYAIRPSMIAGLVPLGTNRSNFPIENIAGVNARTRFDVLGVVFGSLALLVGIAALRIPNVGPLPLFLVVLGLATVVGAPKQAIEVMNSGGGTILFPVSVLERGKTLAFANAVSAALAQASRSTSPNRAALSPSAASDASGSLRDLQRLRDDGLITDAEYASKRAEILARL